MFKLRWLILSAILGYLAWRLLASGALVKQVLAATARQVGFMRRIGPGGDSQPVAKAHHHIHQFQTRFVSPAFLQVTNLVGAVEAVSHPDN